MSASRWVFGKHLVLESLASERRVLEIHVLAGRRTPEIDEALKAARKRSVRVRFVSRGQLDRLCSGGSHQGMAAKVEEEGSSWDVFLGNLSGSDKAKTILVALDRIQDPHNLGAIARSAACLGARALIAPERHSAPLSPAALQASAGALQRIRFFQVGNLSQALSRLKDEGFWIYGADVSGKPVWEVRLQTPMVLVVGSEGEGMREMVRSRCDEILAVPQPAGGIASLNASCAAAVLLYEAARQRSRG